MLDYRHFRFDRLNTDEFRHLWYLLYWPIYGILFLGAERLWIRDYYTPVHCFLDDLIPFCEFFVVPYMFWFVFLAGIIIYTLLFDPDGFKKFMQFIMITYTATIVIYLIFPTCQELRPASFERENIFTRFMQGFYEFDTNTNVCPSIHVIGSVAVACCGCNMKKFSNFTTRFLFWAAAILISVSTVFLKQHSAVDVICAVPLCTVSYFLVYRRKKAPQKVIIKEQKIKERV